MLTVPNFLTLLRILAVPAFLILLTNQRFGIAMVLFMAAGLTDAIDGVIARMTASKSDLGAALDPLADKLFLVSSYIMLTWLGGIPVWLMILVMMRDIVILSGFLTIYFFSTPIQIAPSMLGKVNTCVEMITVTMALATLARPDMPMATANQFAWWVTGTTVTVSGIHYVYTGLLWYQRQDSAAA